MLCIPSVDGLCVKFTDKNNFQLISYPCSIACIVLVFLMCNLVKSTNINKYTIYAELLPFELFQGQNFTSQVFVCS